MASARSFGGCLASVWRSNSACGSTMTAADAPWLDVAGAAVRALVSQPTILRAARRGQLKGYKIGGQRLWRFRPEDVDEWVTQGATPTAFVPRRSEVA